VAEIKDKNCKTRNAKVEQYIIVEYLAKQSLLLS